MRHGIGLIFLGFYVNKEAYTISPNGGKIGLLRQLKWREK